MAAKKPIRKKSTSSKTGSGGETRQTTSSADQTLTTNQGLPISDNQNSLRAGTRGPTLLEDLVFREKITHFDHERIPERIVHARGSGAHGFFQPYRPLGNLTRAAFLQNPKKKTPVFVRFSTVAGGAGSGDMPRDVRGFAVKFYTEEGNFDLVGNNIPIFFIQDAIKFPDLIHSVKMEPDRGFPQAASAHDTFWDFATLMPESMHMLMWAMSDRTIPRSFRMMEGFGVHTFRFVERRRALDLRQVPLAAEARLGVGHLGRIGQDQRRRSRLPAARSLRRHRHRATFRSSNSRSRRSTRRPPRNSRSTCSIPPSSSPRRWCRSIRSAAWCSIATRTTSSPKPSSRRSIPATSCRASISRTIRCCRGASSRTSTRSSFVWAARTSTRFRSTVPQCPMRNFQRDGVRRIDVPKGQVAYEPNSLAPDSPRENPARGFTTFPAGEAGDREAGNKIRERSDTFADHYSQPRLFWRSMSEPEQRHIVNAFTFELSKVATVAIRRRMLGHLANIDGELCKRVEEGLGMEGQAEKIQPARPPIDMKPSPALSIILKAPKTIEGRKIGVLVSDGTDAALVDALRSAVEKAGARLQVVAPKIGGAKAKGGKLIAADHALAGGPSIFFDAVVVAPRPMEPRCWRKKPPPSTGCAMRSAT